MPEDMSFGQWLKQRRKALDLSQEELADRVRCSGSAIRKLEAGQRRPSKQIAELLVDVLAIPAAERASFINFARGLDARLKTAETVTASRSPGNIPARLTRLIGREEIAAEISAHFVLDDVRLLTLTGPPGVGKTSLSLQVASGFTSRFPDGVFFVQLAPVLEAAAVLSAIAKTLDVAESGDSSIEANLLAFLQNKKLLLLLDNFEQVVEAAPSVANILESCPHMKIMTTSREPLHVRGEHVFHVPPLGLPHHPVFPGYSEHDSARAGMAQRMGRAPAVALFVERARALESDFVLTEHNWEAVAAICFHLEGLPLAIELAAARIRILSPEEIRTRLVDQGRENRLALLRGGSRDLPARHQTLRSAIDWSYALLTHAEQRLFCRLGVFVGGCTVRAVEAICNSHADLSIGTLEGIESLLDKNLLKRDESVGGESRYTMLEMIREYALERLAEARSGTQDRGGYSAPATSPSNLVSAGATSEAASIRLRHAEYFLALAEAAQLQKASADQGAWLDMLERDYSNLRAAIQWAIDGSEGDMAARLCSALVHFWRVRGYQSEGRRWLGKVLAAAPPLQILISSPHLSQLSPLALARAVEGAGTLARDQGDYQVAISLHQQSLSAFRYLNNRPGIASSSNNLAVDYHYVGDYDQAEQLYNESLELSRERDDVQGVARALGNLGLIAQTRGEWKLAVDLSRQCVELYRANNSPGDISGGLYNLGIALVDCQNMAPGSASSPEVWKEIEACFTESLALATQLGNKSNVAGNLIKLGELALQREEASSISEAARLFEEGLKLHIELGDRAATAYSLNNLGFTALISGDRATARSLLEEGLRLSHKLGDVWKTMMTLQTFAVAMGVDALAAGNEETAVLDAKRSIQLYAALPEDDTDHVPMRLRYFQTTMVALRTLLPQGELETCQALGRNMSLDEAIALALGK